MAKRQRQELTSLAILPIAWDTFSVSLAEADSETEFAKAGKIAATEISAELAAKGQVRIPPIVETAAEISVRARRAANMGNGNAACGKWIECVRRRNMHRDIARCEQSRRILLNAADFAADADVWSGGPFRAKAVAESPAQVSGRGADESIAEGLRLGAARRQ